MASTRPGKACEIFSRFSDKASRRFAPKCSRIVSFFSTRVVSRMPRHRGGRATPADRSRGFNAVSSPRFKFSPFSNLAKRGGVHLSKFFHLDFTRERKTKLLRRDLLRRLNEIVKETSLLVAVDTQREESDSGRVVYLPKTKERKERNG